MQQAAVAGRLLGRPQHSKPQPPHAIHQLRESEQQDTFEFPPLSKQQAPISGGVVWNLDTPEEQDPQQKTSDMHQPVAAHPSPFKHPQYSSGPEDPWNMAMVSEYLPAAEYPNVSDGHGLPAQRHEPFLQPGTASQGLPVGSARGGSTSVAGSSKFHSQPPPMSNMPVHHSFYGPQHAHMAAVQDESSFYHNGQNVGKMQSAYMSAGMVRSLPKYPIYVPEQRACHSRAGFC